MADSAGSSHPIDPAAVLLKQEAHGAWTLSFFMLPGPEAGPRTFVVEIALAGEMKSRGSSARAGLDESSAIDLLRSRALGWTADYESRGHTGDTGFGTL